MFGRLVESDARDHARECWPEEAVGVVVREGAEFSYLPMENTAPNKELAFRLERYPREAEAVIHSHTQQFSVSPSADDMRSQQAHARPWGIIATNGHRTSRISWFGDQVPPQPYIGREFLSGHADCWCLIRDIYRFELGVTTLPNLPRDEDWFQGQNPPDLLSKANIEEAGFFQVSFKEVRPWDIMLGSLGSRVTNHCGIYIGRNLVLHHTHQQPSCKVPIIPQLKRIRYFLRHTDLQDRTDLPEPKEIFK